ncbi:WD repeat-containing protein 55-like isoform X1 [Brevipalpus obovatus]|uniref:WD repeat-containing protein 55-like isoform X1 n=1 Tax=Brevipalpus obovatus TaxID=246614 RepID=UPI003D9ECD48
MLGMLKKERERIIIEGKREICLDSSNTSKPVSLHLSKHHKGSSIRRIAFTANDHNLVTAAKTIKIFDLNHGKVLRKISAGTSKIHALSVIDQYLLCAGDDEGCFRVWDYRENRGCLMEIKECDDYISDLDVDSDRKIVVASSGEGTLSAFNVRKEYKPRILLAYVNPRLWNSNRMQDPPLIIYR